MTSWFPNGQCCNLVDLVNTLQLVNTIGEHNYQPFKLMYSRIATTSRQKLDQDETRLFSSLNHGIIIFNFSSALNPYNSELTNLHLQSIEVVSRYRDPQLQVTENYFDFCISSHAVFNIIVTNVRHIVFLKC